MRKFGGLALALAAASTANAYYHFVHYERAVSGFRQIPEKFDLSTLVNNTVTYVISQTPPEKLAANDTWTGLVSQIHLAARNWGAVPTSELRLAFGGFVKPGAPASAPEVEIVFEELPPGLNGLGGPTIRGELAGPENARFLPILKSTVILSKDLSTKPSWSESLFGTITHEMGHALGLQHAQSGAAMAVERTRATTKAMPLATDDRAGLSLLYPTPDFAAKFGSITGRVTVGADGINMASVTALTADGTAIGTLTNPDGTYRIDGVPAGNYFLYVSPLRPAVEGEAYPDGVTPPSELAGTVYPASGPFGPQFFPGVQLPDDGSLIVVKTGEAVENADFRVVRQATVPVHTIQTYSVLSGRTLVKPAHLSLNYPATQVVIAGVGATVANGGPAAGLSVSLIGPSVAATGLRPYSAGFMQIDTQLHPFPGEGARHMIFRKDGTTHVVPASVRVVAAAPPVITEMAVVREDAGPTFLEIRGTGFAADSRVMFDGVPAAVASATATAIRVTPPSAQSGHRAAIVILNSDGQSTLFLSTTPTAYGYGDATPAGINITPAALTPGVETQIEITGSGTSFQRNTMLSFGSADILVRRLWVLSATRLVANVIALPGAAPGRNSVVVTEGLRDFTLTEGVQVTDVPARVVSVASAIVDDATGRNAISPNFTARVALKGLAANLTAASFTVRVAGLAAPVISYSNSTLVFRIPAGLPPGPALTEITAAGEAIRPVLAPIDLPPPVIASASLGSAARPAAAKDVVTLRVTGLTEPREAVDLSRLVITVAGTAAKAVQSSIAANNEPGHDIQFEVGEKQTAGTHAVIVTIDGRASAPVNLIFR